MPTPKPTAEPTQAHTLVSTSVPTPTSTPISAPAPTPADTLAARLVPDELWAAISPLLPEARERPQGGGARRRDDRPVLVAVVYVVATGTAWRKIPPWCGVSHATAYRRFAEWTAAQVWERLRDAPGPGHGNRSPGQGKSSPGHSERLPGQSESSPGYADDIPGHGEDFPSQSERSPGQSDDFPGQGEDWWCRAVARLALRHAAAQPARQVHRAPGRPAPVPGARSGQSGRRENSILAKSTRRANGEPAPHPIR
jgi:Putative transposase of IS4/5 family (DUF4096)